jgi:hypothetical protein
MAHPKACEAKMAISPDAGFDPYHRWLAIPKDQRPPTHYQLLGLELGESDLEVIEQAAIRQSTHLRAYQTGPHAALCTRILGEIALAGRLLADPARRKAYDQQLAATSGSQAADAEIPFEVVRDRAPAGARTSARSAKRSASSRAAVAERPSLPWVLVAGAGGGVGVLLILIAFVLAATRSESSPLLAKAPKPTDVKPIVDSVKPSVVETPATPPTPVPPVPPMPAPKPQPTFGPPPAVEQPPMPEGVGKRSVDLIGLLDLKTDVIRGRWQIDGRTLVCDDQHLVPRVQFPYRPPAEYDYVVRFTQSKLRNGISLMMPKPQGGAFFWALGDGAGQRYHFSAAFEKMGALLPERLRIDAVDTTVVEVRRDQFRGLLNGKVLMQHDGFDDLNMDVWRKMRDPSLLALGCDDPTVFPEVRVIEISGPGQRIRDADGGRATPD